MLDKGEKTKQDKRMPQTASGQPQGGMRASRKPTSLAARSNEPQLKDSTGKTENTDKRRRRYIRIDNVDYWDKIDQIMTLPEYRKSFNKVINDALFFGLDMLEKSLFDEVEESDENDQPRIKRVRKINGINEEYFEQVINRLDEVLLGVTLNKSMLCSLYQAKNLELNGKPTIGSLFDNGGYSDTPDYLGAYEARALRRIRG